MCPEDSRGQTAATVTKRDCYRRATLANVRKRVSAAFLYATEIFPTHIFTDTHRQTVKSICVYVSVHVCGFINVSIYGIVYRKRDWVRRDGFHGNCNWKGCALLAREWEKSKERVRDREWSRASITRARPTLPQLLRAETTLTLSQQQQHSWLSVCTNVYPLEKLVNSTRISRGFLGSPPTSRDSNDLERNTRSFVLSRNFSDTWMKRFFSIRNIVPKNW